MSKSLDLGRSYKEPGPVDVKELPEKVYPAFHYEGDEPLDLPKEGVMEITFKVTSESNSEHDGKKHYSCTVEVRSIDEVEGDESDDAPAHGTDPKVSAVLDDLMKAHMASKEKY